MNKRIIEMRITDCKTNIQLCTTRSKALQNDLVTLTNELDIKRTMGLIEEIELKQYALELELSDLQDSLIKD